MPSVNKVIIMGHLGQDPATRATTNGGLAANISIATSEKWKDKTTGELKEQTEWHRVSFFGKLAETVQQYLKKGSFVYVEGRLQTRKWQDQTGADRYTTEIKAQQMQMLDKKPENQSQAASPQAAQAYAQASGSNYTPAPAPPSPVPSEIGGGHFDDDIPF